MTNTLDEAVFCKLMFETASEGMLVTDKEGIILMANPRTAELFGYDLEELVGGTVHKLIPDSAKPNHPDHRKNYFDNPHARPMGQGMNLTGLRKDGNEFPVEISLNYLESNGVPYAVALITDITERVKANKELESLNKNLEAEVLIRSHKLKESEELYATIARNYPNGTISVVDKNMNYVFVEGQGLYSLGITSEKLVGTSYADRLPKALAEDIINKLNHVFKGKNTSFEVEQNNEYYAMNAVGMLNSKNEIDRVLIVEQNITKLKESEKKMIEALAHERQLNEFKSRFVSMASHEFRTPLSTVLSSANLLTRYEGTEEAAKREKHIQRIVDSVQNLTSILNDFLSLSKLEEGKIKPNPTKFDLVDWAKDVADEMQDIAKKGQVINYEHIGKKHDVNVDKNVLRNITANLLSNAIKYSDEDSNIWFYTDFNNQHFEIRVKDEGIGIPETEQNHLFERFFRAKNATNIQGTGLGLHIVKKYAELLGGTVSFSSDVGQGTEFVVSLPQKY